MFYLLDKIYEDKHKKLNLKARKLLIQVDSLQVNGNIMDILNSEINFALLTEEFIRYYDRVGFPFDLEKFDKHFIRSSVQELKEIQLSLNDVYKKNVMKTNYENFDSLLSSIRDCCYKGEYIVPKDSNIAILKKTFLCKLMYYAYQCLIEQKSIPYDEYTRLYDMYECYKMEDGIYHMEEKGILYYPQFGEMVEPLLIDLSDYVFYKANSNKVYQKEEKV